jgi:hypothetical protein
MNEEQVSIVEADMYIAKRQAKESVLYLKHGRTHNPTRVAFRLLYLHTI